MFSKEEATKLRKEFWINFGKSFPKKWLLYNTKVKGLAFKFQADRKSAMVCLDFENPNNDINEQLYNQFIALKTLLTNEIPEIIYDQSFLLDNGKTIKRLYIPFDKKFSIYNKNSWHDCYLFFKETMLKFEAFFYEYEDFIKQVI